MIKKLFLDLNNFKANLGSVERGDSIELNIKLLDGEDYSRSKFRVLGAKADGKYVEQIEGINLEEKDLKIVLEDQFVNCEGIVKLELNVVSSETEITTKEFYFFVSNTMNAEIIDSVDSIKTLEKVSKYVDDAVNNLDALKEASEDITIINSEFKENEIKRKANEMLREKNEKARLQSEDIRITEEEEREANELERIKAENNRKASENNRKVSENTRVTNERAREEAELSRQSTFEENEEIRNSNENLRIESEKERIKFNNKAKTDEVNRKEAETKRVEAEKTRVIAEDERKKAETSRQEAEDIRQNTYTNFNEAEEERRNNEISRQEAEVLRIEAEKRRDDLYSQKEEERNAAFLESERTRGTAFNEAQNDRNLTFEESEAIREEAFKVSEAARDEAEEGRVEAESERVKSEKARVLADEERNTTFTQKEEERNNTFTQNETNRNNTFTQSEEERKATFEEVENARKVAESKRVKAETSRVESEKLRVAAETGRVEAESLRVTAEEERVAAETKREEGFNKFEGKINANTKELKAARSATTGEKFNTLDERIDHEVDRLNKKIEVSFLQQEDKESHTIENTVDGMTTDMIIKGRTLQNLFTTSVNNLALSDVSLDGNTFIVNPVNNRYPSMYDKNGKYKENTNYTVILDILENTLQSTSTSMTLIFGNAKTESVLGSTIYRFDVSNGKKGRFIQNVKTIPDFSILTRNLGLKMYMGNNYTGGKLKFNIMVIETSMLSTKQIPSYFSGIKSFGEAEQEGDKYKISILSSGKNRVNPHDFIETEFVIKFGNGLKNTKISALSNQIIYKKIIKGGSTISYKRKSLGVENESSALLQFKFFDDTVMYTTVQKDRYDIPKDVKEIQFLNYCRGTHELTDFQIEEGSIVSPAYQPYQSFKKDILIKEPLRSIGNIQDILYEDNGQVKICRDVKQYTFTGDEEIIKDHVGYFTLVGTGHKPLSKTINNKYPDKNTINLNENGLWCGNSYKFCIKDLSVSTVEEFKTKLKKWHEEGNPLTVVYQLATPVTEIVENCVDINLKTFGEKTYVSFENAISGTSSFKAPVDTKTTIARLNRENRALEEENKTLRQDFESTTLSLTDSDLELVKQNVDMDFRLMEVEFALDIPQSTLSSNINFKKKGEVKSMARTPYAMMKIVILSGDYDREDYIHKVGKYYERGRMTKEEYDELMSLMTADEVISK